jgi:RecJ-like exonuclease
MANESKSDQVGLEQASQAALNPGDEAAPGTPGTGEDICRQCHGTGRIDGGACPNCGGTGKVVKAIGGA